MPFRFGARALDHDSQCSSPDLGGRAQTSDLGRSRRPGRLFGSHFAGGPTLSIGAMLVPAGITTVLVLPFSANLSSA